MYSENILPSMNVVKKIISGSVSKLQASWNMIFLKQAKLENNYFWKGKKYWDVFLEKAFEMYVWGCVLREAYYFFLWFFNRQAKKENDIWRFFKKHAKVSFTFMYIVSLSAFRLERRSFDFSKFIFTCKYVKLYKLYFYLNLLMWNYFHRETIEIMKMEGNGQRQQFQNEWNGS